MSSSEASQGGDKICLLVWATEEVVPEESLQAYTNYAIGPKKVGKQKEKVKEINESIT